MVPKVSIQEFVEPDGSSPFGEWFSRLDGVAAAVVTMALARLADGNTSRVKSVGHGVAELKIDRGPGYRIYFGWDGRTLVVLLGGGTKRRQNADIATAVERWRKYKTRKTAGSWN